MAARLAGRLLSSPAAFLLAGLLDFLLYWVAVARVYWVAVARALALRGVRRAATGRGGGRWPAGLAARPRWAAIRRVTARPRRHG